ncbi:ketohexokinase-like protein [Bimuria novae-zelandiae CBS 107.79]|uniref:Ketohexokinase-like protein n=1 Tax=Bimuria novae-zelandiae CBS 107.79 TaxID=1447943 RepID=A0A6A5UHR0_9PLEO|nr:ketohexokinase-like protein [Bimuria novae-zelandiae CBS 107.79]
MALTIICVGAVYIDTILSVLRYPSEDEKLRATGYSRRRGGNCANTLEVLSQLTVQNSAMEKGGQVTLYLLCVLPSKQSTDVQFIGRSIPKVKFDGCIFRESFENAASSYIIQAATNNSRTIVSQNPLPEMTTREFIDSASTIRKQSEGGSSWFHFEGRIPTVTEESVRWLCEEFPSTKVSVECEKPGRTYMADVARHADVVFFSRIWAEATSHRDPRDFLQSQLPRMKPGAILVCTWGSEGATCAQSKADEEKGEKWASVKTWKPATGSVEVVDTIGARDTFIAGFLYALNCHEVWPLQQKLEFANELAGRKVLQTGFGGLSEKMGLFGKAAPDHN